MNRFHHVRIKLESFLNNLSLKKKLRYLYFLCILVPIFLTDIVILHALTKNEHAEQLHQMEKIAKSVQSMLSAATEDSALISTSLYMDNSLQDFVSRQYASPQDYFSSYREYIHNSLLQGVSRITNSVIRVYADNETLINGSEFARLSTVSQEPWYQQYTADGYSPRLLFSYDETDGRQVLFLRGMNGLYSNKAECLLCIGINYSTLDRDFQNMGYNDSVYVCSGNRILLTNAMPNYRWQPYDTFSPSDSVGLSQHFTLYGEDLDIYVMEPSGNVLALIRQNIYILILLLILNIIPPQLLMNLLENSITSRLSRLEKVFNQIDSDVLIKISGPSGQDEIGSLMDNYNRMADRMNSLIDTAYRCRLKEQKMDIARQNAELMALYSQINPHFLFNTLNAGAQLAMMEGADRTYDYIQNVADFFRYNVKKGNDIVTLREELELIDHYIYILNVRFSGDIHYEKEISEDLLDCAVPSMILQPIVENCVNHGIREMSGEGRIWLKVYHGEEDTLVISIRDNGIGMDAEIIEKLKNGTYHEKRQSSGSNGIAMGNVIARLKLFTQNEDVMTIRSDGRNQGTEVILYLPVKEREKADV